MTSLRDKNNFFCIFFFLILGPQSVLEAEIYDHDMMLVNELYQCMYVMVILLSSPTEMDSTSMHDKYSRHK